LKSKSKGVKTADYSADFWVENSLFRPSKGGMIDMKNQS